MRNVIACEINLSSLRLWLLFSDIKWSMKSCRFVELFKQILKAFWISFLKNFSHLFGINFTLKMFIILGNTPTMMVYRIKTLLFSESIFIFFVIWSGKEISLIPSTLLDIFSAVKRSAIWND